MAATSMTGINTPGNGLFAHGIGKSYKKREVVKNVSIEVHRGEAVGLLGPNGAGKTTSFYMIVGLIQPDTGSITLDGADITHLPCTAAHGWALAICRRKPVFSVA